MSNLQSFYCCCCCFICQIASSAKELDRFHSWTRHANFVIPDKRRKANRCQVLITHVMPAPAPVPARASARLGQSAKCAAQKFWPEREGGEGVSKDSVNCVTVVSAAAVIAQGCCICQGCCSSRVIPSDCCGACKYFSWIKTAATNNCQGSWLTD